MKLLTYSEIDHNKILTQNQEHLDIFTPVKSMFHNLNNFYCYSDEDIQNNINFLIEISKTKTMIKI